METFFFKFFPANDDGNLLLKLNRPNCDENEGEGSVVHSLFHIMMMMRDPEDSLWPLKVMM